MAYRQNPGAAEASLYHCYYIVCAPGSQNLGFKISIKPHEQSSLGAP